MKLCVFTLFISILSYSQIKINTVVVDSKTKQTLSFVAVQIIGKNTGIYSNEFGKVILSIDNTDNLKFSCLGYEEACLKSKDIKDSIFLKQNDINLKDVVLLTKKNKKQTIGYIEKKKTLRWHIKPKTELTTLIKSKKEIKKAYISKVLIPIGKEISGFKAKKYLEKFPPFESLFKLSIFSNENGIPGKNLLDKQILIHCNQDTKNIIEIDISDQFIPFNEKGVFIGIEMVGKFNNKGDIDQEKQLNILPSFLFTKENSKNLISNSFIKRVFGENKWEKIDKSHKDFSIVSDYNMAVSLTLDIYE